MASAAFFSQDFFTAFTPVSSNLDYQDVKPFIQTSQKQLLKTRIGKSLYDRLIEAITNQDWNSNELELILLLREPVCLYTAYNAWPFLQSKMKNKGLVMSNGQAIQTVTEQNMINLRQELLQHSNYYMNEVDEYLRLNSGNFPEYSSSDPLNHKNDITPYDFGGFFPYKSYASGGSECDAIKKIIGYRGRGY